MILELKKFEIRVKPNVSDEIQGAVMLKQIR